MKLFRIFLLGLFILAGCYDPARKDRERGHPPNILLIFADDLGYGDLAVHENPDVQTPHLDKFAAEAVRFEPFYAQPVCAPSRAQILTGRHFLETGIWHVYEEGAHLNPEETILPEVLKKAGYYTAFIGKWTLGRHGPYLPENRGFDDSWRQALEVPGNLYQHENPQVNINGKITRLKGWASSLYTDFALEAIDRSGNKPFFIELAHISTHEPYYAPDSLVRFYLEKGFSISLSTFYAMVEQLDHETGRLLDELDKRGLTSNTLVIFTSDNGPIGNCRNLPHLTEEEMARRNPLDLRGRKGTIFENGIRVPGFFRFPGKFPPRILRVPADLADIYPTLIELAGTSIPDDNLPVYGKSLVSLLTGEAETIPDRFLYYGSHQVNWTGRKDESGYVHDRNDFLFEGTHLAILAGDFKYVQYARNDDFGTKNQITALYDLKNDVRETSDISKDLPETRKKLGNELRRWWEEEVIKSDHSYQLPTYYLGYGAEREVEVHVGSATTLYGDIDYRAVNWVLGLVDWKGEEAGVDYRMKVIKGGMYEVFLNFQPGPAPCNLEVALGDHDFISHHLHRAEKQIDLSFGPFQLDAGESLLRIRMKGVQDPSLTGIVSLDKIVIRKVNQENIK